MVEGVTVWGSFDDGGAFYRRMMDEYGETSSRVTKSMILSVDMFLFGIAPTSLAFYYGDLRGTKKYCTKWILAHTQLKARYEAGALRPADYMYETWGSTTVSLYLLYLSGELELLKEFLANSLAGLTLTDRVVSESLDGFFEKNSWVSEEGKRHSTKASVLLMRRACEALAHEDTEASRSALRAWLPAPSELVHIVDTEVYFYRQTAGHPALLCALLQGERLDAWDAASQVSSRVLQVEEYNVAIRHQALCLLGRAHAACGRRNEACRAATQAADDAARARFPWLEMLAVRDLLRYQQDKGPYGSGGGSVECEMKGEAAGVWPRLVRVTRSLAASPQELAGVLGEEVSARLLDAAA
jgi:hypothetical protein